MYPQANQAASLTGTSGVSTHFADTAVPQTSAGVASMLQMLGSEVDGVLKGAYGIRGALGIANPPSEAKEPSQPSSLVELLAQFKRKLAYANDDLSAVIAHINS